jgi:hypothetical protein
VVSPAWTPRSRYVFQQSLLSLEEQSQLTSYRETSLPRVARPPAVASSPVTSVPVRLVARVAAPPVVPNIPRNKLEQYE